MYNGEASFPSDPRSEEFQQELPVFEKHCEHCLEAEMHSRCIEERNSRWLATDDAIRNEPTVFECAGCHRLAIEAYEF